MSNIVSIIRSAIETGSYDLSSMLETIAYHQAHGGMTLEEMEELTGKARENAKTQYKEGDIATIILQLHDLDERVKKLEQGGSEPAPKEYPEYVAGKWYYNGDGCTFESKKYDCIAPKGVVCVWSPAEYPTYWQEVE